MYDWCLVTMWRTQSTFSCDPKATRRSIAGVVELFEQVGSRLGSVKVTLVQEPPDTCKNWLMAVIAEYPSQQLDIYHFLQVTPVPVHPIFPI